MKCFLTRVVLLAFATAMFVSQPSSQAQSTLVKAGAREIIEAITQRFGQVGLKEVMEKVGQESIEELVQRAVSEGGEQAAKSVIKIAGEHGLQAINVLRRAPGVFSQALENIPPDMVSQALGAIERNPDLMTRVATKLGGRAIQTELRHPGIGARLVDVMGDDGVRLAEKLTTNNVKKVMPYVEDLGALSAPDKKKVIDKILDMPAAVLDYLEKHPKVLMATGGVAAVLAIKDNAFGKTGNRVVAPDGTVTEPAPGFIERMYVDTTSRFWGHIGYVIVAVGSAFVLIVLVRGGVHIWKHWHLAQIRVAVERGKMAANPPAMNQAVQPTRCEPENDEKKF